jgi:glycosyltransferase involved in cell wall biosynthesis
LVQEHKVDPEKVEVIKNGINIEMFSPVEKDKDLLKTLNLENEFIIGYIGTHGMAHKLDFILDCAQEIEDEDVHFVFVGTGAEKENLLAQKAKLALKNTTLIDSVPKDEVSKYISILDVGLVNLRKSDTFKSVIPSKIFELAAMQKPILLGVEGESKELVESYGVGLAFEPENKTDFLKKIEIIKNRLNQERGGVDRLLNDFDRKKLALNMLNFLRSDVAIE